MTDVRMPQMGESIAEGTVSVWLIDVGQWVDADQPLVTVSTDKADVDIPSPAGGVLSEIIAVQGETVKVGALIARIDEAAVKPSAGKKPAAPPAEAPPGREGPTEPVMPKEGVAAAEAMRPKEPEIKAPPEIKKEEAPPTEEAVDRSGFYSPAVMRLAVEHGIDLKTLKGTGMGGRVTKADVMQAVEGGKPLPKPAYREERVEPTPIAPGGRGEGAEAELAPPIGEGGFGTYRPPVYEVGAEDIEMPFSRLRRLIADHMVYSKRTSPHVTTFTEVDLDQVVGIRERNKAKVKADMGISLTFLPFVALAAIRALKDYPLMNSVVQGDKILIKKRINMGIAVDSERGLMVPVIKDVRGMGLLDLARAVDDLSVRVRDRKVMPDEMSGGTFTVTNPGRKGNLFGTPIISQPQVGILRMGEVVKRAVVVEAGGEDAIAIRPTMYLSLSYDHRVVDGLTANEFLHRIKEHLEEGDFPV